MVDLFFADVGPVPPPDYVARQGRAMVVARPPVPVPPPRGGGYAARGRGVGPDDGAIDGVRRTFARILAGLPEDGWRDLDRDILQGCLGAPPEWQSLLLRAAVFVARHGDGGQGAPAGPAQGRIRLRDDPAGPAERRVRGRHDPAGPAEEESEEEPEEEPEDPRDPDE
jgi:hypothetical protein